MHRTKERAKSILSRPPMRHARRVWKCEKRRRSVTTRFVCSLSPLRQTQLRNNSFFGENLTVEGGTRTLRPNNKLFRDIFMWILRIWRRMTENYINFSASNFNPPAQRSEVNTTQNTLACFCAQRVSVSVSNRIQNYAFSLLFIVGKNNNNNNRKRCGTGGSSRGEVDERDGRGGVVKSRTSSCNKFTCSVELNRFEIVCKCAFVFI